MNIILFTHPSFLDSTSMPIFSEMIYQYMRKAGHHIEKWSPPPFFYRIPLPNKLKKWLGYIDQYLLFPFIVRRRLRKTPLNFLFVFSDQALGPWVPLVSNRPHVIHCHDFLALRSALGEFPQNPTSLTGKLYQKMICDGFNKGKNFISVSKKTNAELHRFINREPHRSEVIYNGMNYSFKPIEFESAMDQLCEHGVSAKSKKFILHVGGNQWYKNRSGVIAIYEAYCKKTKAPYPLVIMGAAPSKEQEDLAKKLVNNGSIQFIVQPPTSVIEAGYSAASALLFPSIAEGFGWPIIEAMACGCPVLTTNDDPMTEIGGTVAYYLPRWECGNDLSEWAEKCAIILANVVDEPVERKQEVKRLGLLHSRQFSSEAALSAYSRIYTEILESEAL